jgi:hypothetical protein
MAQGNNCVEVKIEINHVFVRGSENPLGGTLVIDRMQSVGK